MNEKKGVKTVLEKRDKFKGRLRKQETKWILGEKTKEVLYKENNCLFRFNVDSCYFSPRLSSDRLEIAKMTKKGENVLVMFGGIGVYALVVAKNSKCKRVVSVELNRECSKYALENVRKNKLQDRIEIVQGDVRKVIGKGKKIEGKFDRVMMARPNLKDSFLDIAFSVVKNNGIIHYHGFYNEKELDELRKLLMDEAKKAGKKIKIRGIKKAGEIGVRKYRFRADIMVVG